MRPARLSAAGCGIAAGVLVALSLPAGPAAAHADLLRTDPAAGTVVGSLPAAVILTFSEQVQPVAGQIQVIAPDGGRADGDRVSAAATSTVRIPLRGDGPSGTYAVSYRVISDDGHPVIGVMTFSVRVPSAVPPVPVPAGAPAGAVPLRLAMGAADLVAVAGLVLLAGPLLFLLRLWPAGVSRRGAGRLLRTGLVLVAAGTTAELCLQAPYTGGAVRQVLVSEFGLVHMARLAVLAAMAVPLARVAAGRGGRIRTAILAPVVLATWPLAGHPRTSALPVLTVVADAAHLGAVALWLGGLVTLLAFVLRSASAAELSRILPAWSRWAQWAVVILVAGGVVEAIVQVRGFDRLVDTSYGRLVMAKVAVLAMVLVVAGYSRRLVLRRFDAVVPEVDPAVPPPVAASGTVGVIAPAARAPAAPPPVRRRLRRAVLTETAGIVVVLALAMSLVRTDPASARAPADDYLTGPGVVGGLAHMGMLTSPTAMAQVRVSPAVTGANHVQVYAYTRAGAPLTVLSWQGTAELPGRAPLDIPLTGAGANHAAGRLRLPWPGVWQLRFTMTLAGAPPTGVAGTVAVRAG